MVAGQTAGISSDEREGMASVEREYQGFPVTEQRAAKGPGRLDLEGLRSYVLGSEYARIIRQAAIPPERRRATGL